MRIIHTIEVVHFIIYGFPKFRIIRTCFKAKAGCRCIFNFILDTTQVCFLIRVLKILSTSIRNNTYNFRFFCYIFLHPGKVSVCLIFGRKRNNSTIFIVDIFPGFIIPNGKILSGHKCITCLCYRISLCFLKIIHERIQFINNLLCILCLICFLIHKLLKPFHHTKYRFLVPKQILLKP